MAKKSLGRGIFITFEGPEGCGKSTHSKLIFEYLSGRGYECILTREPGGTKAGEAIRQILLHSDGINISDMTELFLFEAARAQIVGQIIKPSLEKGITVICDRFSDATKSYQGYGGGVDTGIVDTLNKIATGSLVPDITILLDVDPRVGLERSKVKGIDRMESKGIEYHKRVRAGYLEIAKKDPQRIRVISVAESIENTQKQVRFEIDKFIAGKK